MVILALPEALSLSGLPSSSAGVATGAPGRPRSPALLLIPIKLGRLGGLEWRGCSLTAVVLLMVISSEFPAVVTPTHEISLTTSMTIIETSISRTVTVSLSLVTRLLWSTTSLPVVVTAPTPLSLIRNSKHGNYSSRSVSEP